MNLVSILVGVICMARFSHCSIGLHEDCVPKIFSLLDGRDILPEKFFNRHTCYVCLLILNGRIIIFENVRQVILWPLASLLGAVRWFQVLVMHPWASILGERGHVPHPHVLEIHAPIDFKFYTIIFLRKSKD